MTRSIDAQPFRPDPDLTRSPLSAILVGAYAVRPLRSLCLQLALKLERGEFHSATLRIILARYHGLRIGAYSYGPCLTPGLFPPGVTIGRYVSIAHGVRVLLRNHPTDRISMHPFFFNHRLGYVEEDAVPAGRLWIGHDAWLGENAIVTPSCRRIGIGAVVGAGAVVTRDVPDFAIVAGNPAGLIRFRHSPEIVARLHEARFWEQNPESLRRTIQAFADENDRKPAGVRRAAA
jgi:acetyltransferase-like isoleucine patch superfamily enzyme